MENAMRRHLVIVIAAVLAAAPALALDMPTRKAGLWELKMVFEGRNLPPTTLKHCTDAATDKLMNANFGGSNEQNCSKQDMKKSGGTITVDSVCKFGEATTTSHAVITGMFDSAYTMKVASTRAGGPQLPGMAPGAETHMMIEAKWLGPCAAGQKPGDVIMSNGRTMNVLDLQKTRVGPAR
jgi:hypothetical protein